MDQDFTANGARIRRVSAMTNEHFWPVRGTLHRPLVNLRDKPACTKSSSFVSVLALEEQHVYGSQIP